MEEPILTATPPHRTPPTRMHRYIDVHRAAKLAGVTRGEIQRLISENSLNTFEGKVEFGELIKLFPEIEQSRSSMVEVVAQIKEDAVAKAIRERPGYRTTDPRVLRQECDQLAADLAYYQALALRYKRILVELRPKLEALREKSEHKNLIQTIINWYVHKTKEFW